MVAFDTNVFVRLLVGDHAEQTRRAERRFLAHARSDGVYLSLLVLAELGWVLSRGYHFDRRTVHALLARLVRTRGVLLEDPELVFDALAVYQKRGIELADLLILGRARSANALPLYTFDRGLARESGVRAG